MERYVCIHGHFYQPPRENPWLEEVEFQDSAYPYHDWNTRITEECYRQNAASRILAPDKRIIDIVSNYASISFDFGPTLLYWLQSHEPDIYGMVIAADKEGATRFSGHGPAIAQAYNHVIMPLANNRDKHTQVIWGLKDFEIRFGRKPEGMWLPETAVNIETLEVLTEHGITFTILAPRQAKQVRRFRSGSWDRVDENTLDITMPYACNLPSGRSITLFFYHGRISNDLAYGTLLRNGETLARNLAEQFKDGSRPAQLIHAATDGESFGHHHRYGDMALAYCLHHLQTNNLAKITVYSEYLEKFPPTHEVEIWENTSWSCVHGIDRWKSNCGCSANQALSGRQQWKAPLRQAMDLVRDNVVGVYEKKMSQYCPDPWQVRNDYIAVINDRSAENVQHFIAGAAGRQLGADEEVAFLKLLEMQRNAMLMYTSCGWFFDNVSGIETIQVMQYAARAMQLCRDMGGEDLDPQFKEILKQAPCNTRQFASGKEMYEAYVEPARIDVKRVGAHFALTSVFDEHPEKGERVYCYSATLQDFERTKAGVQTLSTGRATIQSNITLEKDSADWAVLHLGDHNLIGALGTRMKDEDFHKMQRDVRNAFDRGDVNEVMHQMNSRFNGTNYSLWHLFKDEQRWILNKLLDETWQEIEGSFRQVYEHHYSIMLLMRSMNMPLPKALSAASEFILNHDLSGALKADKIDLEHLRSLADEALRLSLKLDETTLRFEASRRINQLMADFEKAPDDLELLATILAALNILSSVISDMDLQTAQNVFFAVGKEKYHENMNKSQAHDNNAAEWIELFESLAGQLGVVVQ